MKYTENKMTGESLVGVAWPVKLMWNNQPITKSKIQSFLEFVDIKGIAVTLSNRRTRRAWGTCWPIQKRMILYRHSVWVFLHELAHILSKERGHGWDFATSLELLYDYWVDWVGENCLSKEQKEWTTR